MTVYVETNNQGTRPARILPRLGEIPAELPSVYDFIEGDYGVEGVVVQALQHGFVEHRAYSSRTAQGFVDDYIAVCEFQKKGNYVPWKETLARLLVATCRGWMDEEAQTRELSDLPDELNRFLGDLAEHLKLAEKMWGVTWLTSSRPIEGQEFRELPALEDYLDQYQSAGCGTKFWLNIAGDLTINLARLATDPAVYAKWQQEADTFVSQ